MNNLDPYIKELKDENEIITEENIKLKKVIEVLKEENEKLKQELNNFHLDKKNSKDNFISTSENNNEEKIKDENKIKVERKAQKLNQKINNSDSNEKNSKENLISKNKNNQEKINFELENIENQQHNQKLNNSDSVKKIIKDTKPNSNNNNNILSKELKNKLINYIKESETYKDKIISFKLLYKASIDGDLASSFHNKVDNKGPILVIIKTTIENRIIGGFSSKPWSSKNKYIEDNKAFLFLFNDFNEKKFKIK